MMVEGSIIGTILTIAYFQRVAEPGVREGLLLGATWRIENWLVDFVGVPIHAHACCPEPQVKPARD